MSIVYDELEFALPNHLVINHFIKTRHITPKHITVTQDVNSSNLIKVDTTKIFTEIEILYLPFSCLVDVQAIVIKNFDINNTLIKRRDTYMHTAHRLTIANNIAHHRQRNLIDIINIDTRRRQTSINTALNHTRRAVCVTIERYYRAFGENTAVGSTQFRRKLWRQIHIHQTSDPIATEKATPSLRSPNNAGIDNGSSLNLLVRPNLYIGLHDRSILNNSVIANHRPFKHHRLTLNVGRRANNRTT